LPIAIKVTGNYHDIGQFTSDIANLPRIVTLNNLSLTTNKDGALGLDAVAKTFRYLDKDEVENQRAAAQKNNTQKGKKKGDKK
jgi:type IV pilus assembly protein PilO